MKKMKIVIRADKDPLCEKIPVCSVWILKDESKTSSSGCLVFFSSVALVFPSDEKNSSNVLHEVCQSNVCLGEKKQL